MVRKRTGLGIGVWRALSTERIYHAARYVSAPLWRHETVVLCR
jgi:hypothetical protein